MKKFNLQKYNPESLMKTIKNCFLISGTVLVILCLLENVQAVDSKERLEGGIIAKIIEFENRIQQLEKNDFRNRIEQLENNVSFIISLRLHKSTGTDYELSYKDNPIIDTHKAWDGEKAFIIPADGTYYLNVTFIKDALKTPFTQGTRDDVRVTVTAYSVEGQGNKGFGKGIMTALSGQQRCDGRYTAFGNTIVQLKKGQHLTTKVLVDGKTPSLLKYITFSLFKISN